MAQQDFESLPAIWQHMKEGHWRSYPEHICKRLETAYQLKQPNFTLPATPNFPEQVFDFNGNPFSVTTKRDPPRIVQRIDAFDKLHGEVMRLSSEKKIK